MLSHPHIMARSIPSLCVPQPLPKINLVFYTQPEVVGFYDVYDIGKFLYKSKRFKQVCQLLLSLIGAYLGMRSYIDSIFELAKTCVEHVLKARDSLKV